MKKRLLILSIIALSLLVTCCGYSIHGRAGLPFPSITIDHITNRTYEPGIEDRMRKILTEELVKSGFTLDRSSDYRIYGSIDSLELRTLSEKSGVAVEYEVVIKGDFKLKTPSRIRNLRSSGPFIVSFTSPANLQGVMALKERAIEKALRDLSDEIIASIIHES